MSSFTTVLYPTQNGLCAPYAQPLVGKGFIVVEVYYKFKNCEFVDIFFQVPEGTIVLEPQDIKPEDT